MSDGMDQPKEELHVDANEAERAAAAPSEQKSTGGSKWAPSTYTDPAGAKIESTLGTVGKPVGDVLAKGTAPIGNVVDSAVGGIMRAGDMAQSQTGLGKEQDEARKADEEFKKPIGGKEQTGQNPLGL